MAQGGRWVFSTAHNKTGRRSADTMKFSPTPSANRVGRNGRVSKIAAGRGKAWQGVARPGGARRCKAKQGEVTSSIQRAYCWMHWRKLQRGVAGRGMAWRGLAWLGKDKQGKARLIPNIRQLRLSGGMEATPTGRGRARRGGARLGMAWLCAARQGNLYDVL